MARAIQAFIPKISHVKNLDSELLVSLVLIYIIYVLTEGKHMSLTIGLVWSLHGLDISLQSGGGPAHVPYRKQKTGFGAVCDNKLQIKE
jgi:hypothetical protein